MVRTLEEIYKEGYITKDDVLFNLEESFFIFITPRTLKFYGTAGLVDSGIKENIKGFVGSVSLYPKNTPEIVYLVKWLQVEARLTLDWICEYFRILKIDRDYIKKLKKIDLEYNKLLKSEEEKEELFKRKDTPKEEWGKELAKLEKFKIDFWKNRERISICEEYIKGFRFTAINRALIELGILSVESNLKNIKKYILAGDLKVEKDRIRVFFEKLVNKEVIFLKNKIEVRDSYQNKDGK